MKKITVVFITFALVSSGILSIYWLYNNDKIVTSWDTQQVELHSNACEVAMVLDSSDRPAIAYIRDYGKSLAYAKLEGEQWIVSTVDDGSSFDMQGLSMALNDQDYPSICYMKGRYHPALICAAWTGSGWNKTVIAGVGNFSAMDDTNPSIDIDNNDTPHVCYYRTGYDETYYASQENGLWLNEKINTSIDCYISTSIIVDDSRNPHIAINVVGGSSSYTSYLTKINGSWANDVIDQVEEGYYGIMHTSAPSIIIDNEGLVNIAYNTIREVGDHQSKLFILAIKVGNVWEKIDVSNGAAAYLITMDKNHGLYYISSIDNAITYIYWQNGVKEQKVIESITGDYSVLTIDSKHNPHFCLISNTYEYQGVTYMTRNKNPYEASMVFSAIIVVVITSVIIWLIRAYKNER